MGLSYDQVQNKEREERTRLLNEFLEPHGLTEKDVKELTEKSGYGVSVVKLDDNGTEQYLLFKRVAKSKPYRVKVDYTLEVTEDAKPAPRKERRAKKKSKK